MRKNTTFKRPLTYGDDSRQYEWFGWTGYPAPKKWRNTDSRLWWLCRTFKPASFKVMP